MKAHTNQAEQLKKIEGKINSMFVFKLKSLIFLILFIIAVTIIMQFCVMALEAPRNDIIVNQKILENVHFRSGKGSYMFPLRAVMEQLGYNVQWNEIDKSIDLQK